MSKCAEGTNVLSVYLSGPAYKGSSEEKPYAEGKIVKYVVTAVPTTGPTITVEGEGAPDGEGVSPGSLGAGARWELQSACLLLGS